MGLCSWSLIENIKSSSEHFIDNLKSITVCLKFVQQKNLAYFEKILIILDYIYLFYFHLNTFLITMKESSHYKPPPFSEDTNSNIFLEHI